MRSETVRVPTQAEVDTQRVEEVLHPMLPLQDPLIERLPVGEAFRIVQSLQYLLTATDDVASRRDSDNQPE